MSNAPITKLRVTTSDYGLRLHGLSPGEETTTIHKSGKIVCKGYMDRKVWEKLEYRADPDLVKKLLSFVEENRKTIFNWELAARMGCDGFGVSLEAFSGNKRVEEVSAFVGEFAMHQQFYDLYDQVMDSAKLLDETEFTLITISQKSKHGSRQIVVYPDGLVTEKIFSYNGKLLEMKKCLNPKEVDRFYGFIKAHHIAIFEKKPEYSEHRQEDSRDILFQATDKEGNVKTVQAIDWWFCYGDTIPNFLSDLLSPDEDEEEEDELEDFWFA